MGRDQSAEHRPWDFAAVTTRRLATLTMPKPIPAPHPSETILEDVLKPLDMSVNQLATNLGVTATRLNDIVRGRRGVTADTALRLARYLGTSAEFWLGLQLEYDLRMARQTKLKEIERAVRPRTEAA